MVGIQIGVGMADGFPNVAGTGVRSGGLGSGIDAVLPASVNLTAKASPAQSQAGFAKLQPAAAVQLNKAPTP